MFLENEPPAAAAVKPSQRNVFRFDKGEPVGFISKDAE